MYIYVYVAMALGVVSFLAGMCMLGCSIEDKPLSKGQIAFRAIIRLAFTIWAAYLIFGVAK